MSTSKKDAQRVKRKLRNLEDNVDNMGEKMRQNEPRKIVNLAKSFIEQKFENNDRTPPIKIGNGGKGGSEQHLSDAFELNQKGNTVKIKNTAEHADTLERGRTQKKYQIPASLEESPIFTPGVTKKTSGNSNTNPEFVIWRAAQNQTDSGFNYLRDAQKAWRSSFDPQRDLRNQIRKARFKPGK